jgi:hypothetical protein
MRDYDAKLFFVQGRLMTQDDFETQSRSATARAESNRPQSPSRYTSDVADIRDRRLVSSYNNAPSSSSPQKRDGSQRPPVLAATSRKR